MENANFIALRELHEAANKLLHSQAVKECFQHVEEVSESSMRMLDVCSVSKNVLSLVREHIRDLRFTLRNGELDISTKIAAYDRYRKRVRKETVKCLESLRAIRKRDDRRTRAMNRNLEILIYALKEIRLVAVSAIESLAHMVSVPWLHRKCGKGSMSCMLMRGKPEVSRDLLDEMAVWSACTRLEAAEIALDELESEFECVSRRLIVTRVSLLNILNR